jgi:hypothetical protein
VEKRKAFPTRIPYTTAAATRSTQAATTLTQGETVFPFHRTVRQLSLTAPVISVVSSSSMQRVAKDGSLSS